MKETKTINTAQPKLTRRQFAKLLTGGAATMALGSLFGCTTQQAAAAEAHATFDYDVVVLGGGGAGVTAVGQAAAAGAKAVLVEKMAWLAGSSSLAIGTFYGAGTQLQKAAGIEDDPAGLLDYFLSRGGDKLDYDVQKFCADHFGETIDWLVGELGVPFKDKVSKKGKDTVERGHNCVNNAMDALRAVTAFAQEKGAEFHFGTAVESLVVDDSGAVCGVLAKRGNGETVRYNAKNVIVATGGFCRNEGMIDEYCPDYSGVYTEVGVGCTGEGLKMGLDLGADYVGHGGTNGILACPVEPGQSKLINKQALWITTAGERFTNEGGQTHDIYYDVAHFDDQKFYAVYDQAMVDALNEDLRPKFEFGLEEGMFAKGETVAEAASALGIDGAAAQAALDAYNELAAAGEDTQFKKKAENLIPLTTAPYYVLTMGVCTHGSFGGYRVNTEFKVLDTAGEPIPNLYAAGEVCCGTFIYDDYPAGGCGLNWSYTSGRFAGKNAAEAALA
ncbi:FAD-dependent oxidoreductase [Arabiibacter massiliensis]|uniref:FAD-dependent oxidoreductase n=1 Tax=Arabiibacter massiliensis TaxID=1870985 RepID=UPI0009B933AB|nr:FAD-dependent oxidoreductase [Arabiibacter massiliensis]